nr:protein-glutamate O-methyltransferase CheR [Burkholderiaceae bacterium]
AQIDALLDAVHAACRHDFRGYARSTLRRRIALAQRRLGCGDPQALCTRVLSDATALAAFVGLMTVQVSAMFRDPGYFRALRHAVLPQLRDEPLLRIWVAGCSAGEELWSLAIVLAEEGLLDRCRLYATDIHPEALQRAQAGIYPLDRIAEFSRNYLAAGGRGSLNDYLAIGYGNACVARALAAPVVFADHSLASDGVFADMQLVSCRNVLIYFERALQDRALGLFADSLVQGGFLGLGARETLRWSAHAAAFAEFLPAERLWRRVAAAPR